MIESVLFASDFSVSSERALAHGVDLVERTGAALHFMHVQEVSMGPFVGGEPSPKLEEEKFQKQYRERCREAMAPYALGPGGERVSCVVERSSAAAPTLVEYAETHEVDLIVMGTHGRRGVQRALFGSVAEEVLRTAPCPVLTTRVPEEDAQASTAPGVERIVVPIDFSEPSQAALQYATQLAPLYDVPMTLVHVVQLPSIPTVYELEFPDLSPEDIEARVQAVLEDWEGSVSSHRDLSYVVESGEPVPTILRIAADPSDLIVMATRGLSGVKRTVLGSVAEGVIRRASGPVISARSFPEED
jgi:nucleotide-binding universal stress UspA family protein